MTDDLISRQAAIDAILHNQEVYSKNFGDDPIDKYTIAIIDNDAQTIAQLPSADRAQGEWIVNNYKSVCSVCGANETDFIYGTEMWYGLGESKFCPNCGARMKGAGDETD